jgi:hypothetical protein
VLSKCSISGNNQRFSTLHSVEAGCSALSIVDAAEVRARVVGLKLMERESGTLYTSN